MDVLADAIEDYYLVPCGANSKGTLHRWKNREYGLNELRRHVARGGNIGCMVGKTRGGVFVVVDQDGEEADGLIAEHGLDSSNMQVVTASGKLHRYFRVAEPIERTRIKLEGLPLDVKATGYIVFVGSRIDGNEYRFLSQEKGLKRPSELVELPQSFVERIREEPISRPRIVRRIESVTADIRSKLERHLRYVEKIDRSEQGNNGSCALLRACLKILTLVDGDMQHAWPLAVHYNRCCCTPNWNEEEETGPNSLKRKLEEARKVWKPKR